MENRKVFKSSLTYLPEEVSKILHKKIEEENKIVEQYSSNNIILFEENLLQQIEYIPGKVNVTSLFSGAGGLDLGVKLAGISAKYGEQKAYKIFKDKKKFQKYSSSINIMYSNDLFKSANETYLSNFGNEGVQDDRDIRKVSNFPQSDLMLGGFPCPGFSSAGPRLLDDPRNFLYIHYIRALSQARPAFFIAENVKGILTMAKGQVIEQIKEDFSAVGYQVSAYLVNAKDYGVPQSRERVFIIGVRKDIINEYNFQYELPEDTHGEGKIKYATLRDAIEDLPLNANDVFTSNYSPMYMSRNRKKGWDEPSFTIQASGRQAPQHPAGNPMIKLDKDLWRFSGDFNRRLSVREAARIQTFPDWFMFSDGSNPNVSKNNRLNEQYKQIGNAVPSILAEKISRPIIEFLVDHKELLE